MSRGRGSRTRPVTTAAGARPLNISIFPTDGEMASPDCSTSGGQHMRTHQIPADWGRAELADDSSWIRRLTPSQGERLAALAHAQQARGLDLLDYVKADFELGDAAEVFAAAFAEARDRRGIAVVKGLPTEGLSEAEYRLLTWGIGLNFGVATPQGKTSQLISEVRNIGTVYRSAKGGRGYSSRSGIDFHSDGSDIAVLTCLRTAKSGGQSRIVSSARAYNQMVERAPQAAAVLFEDYWFTRQGEEAPDEAPAYAMSLFAEVGDDLYVRYNKNIRFAQGMDGVPEFTEAQIRSLEIFEQIIEDPENVFDFWLEPGDMQIINDYHVLHARTEFEDHEGESRQRLLFRLWLSMPGSAALPPGWEAFYRSRDANTVRGGIRGLQYGPAERAYELRQAQAMGMRPGADERPPIGNGT